ncbi:universal stress protein [Nocardia sp. NPDC056100]|uniref:universal stress protein n=1 Tax=Nocardia sp. NPDC056100 TaxID=3345712 RepID=UPI0035DEDA4C
MIDRPVVAGVDSSESAGHAVRWAAIDAALHGAELHLVFAVPPFVETPLDDNPVRLWHDEYRQTAEQALADAARAAVAFAAPYGDIKTRTFLVDAPPIPTLNALAATARYVVVGSRGLGAYHRSLLGSVSMAVTRYALGPVVVVPGEPAPDSTLPVVVGVDGSPYSTRAIEVAFDEASRRGAGLVAVHVWDRLGQSGSGSQQRAEKVLADSLAHSRAEFPGVSVRSVVAEDRPVRALLAESEAAQLVVVGSHGVGGFQGMTLGSTGEALLPVVACPIAIVRLRN